MNFKHFIAAIILLWTTAVFSQIMDNMESYTVGEPIINNWWGNGDCTPGPGCNLISSDAIARSGIKSGWVPEDGTTVVGLDLGNTIFGQIYVNFYMYIPSDKEAIFQLVDNFPVGNGNPILGNFFFNSVNPGMGYIDDCPNAPVYFEFPHDEWFEFDFFVDIYTYMNTATFELKVNNVEVIPPGTPLTNNAGEYPIAVGGLKFMSNAATGNYYLDDIEYWDGIIVNGVGENKSLEVTIHPNPVRDKLVLTSTYRLDKIQIYNTQGQPLFSYENTTEIDITALSSGIYFIEVCSEDLCNIQKFIKF